MSSKRIYYKRVIIILFVCLISLSTVYSSRKYTKDDLKTLRDEVKAMFDHAYSGYIKYAYPYDELRPLTCDGVDTWGSYSLTLIDALDTLAVMGNYSEFRRVADLVVTTADFDANINVSVFETNIRVLGGLLSAHLLSYRAGMELEPGWPCNGPLLRLAEDVAKRLLPAFDTATGMPFGTVNLRYGVPPGETSVTCTAGVGTFILEFGALTRLTGDPLYEEVAMNALYSLFEYRSKIGLFGNHIDVQTGRWTAQDSGIGAGVDSYLEYLVKGAVLLGRPELRAMFATARPPIERYLNKNGWYVWASMTKGQVTLPVFQSLDAYWPGLLSLIGDMEGAVKSLHNYRSVWKQLGFTPEFYNIGDGEAGRGRESYPLRPELAESAMLLYRATGDPALLDIGVDILTSIRHSAATPCGYATIKDTRDHTLENRMESFFLAETTKYLYLLFDPDNFLHNDGAYGTEYTLPSGRQCLVDTGPYIFNTEAHPLDAGALSCCYDWIQEKFNLDKESFKGELFTPLSTPSTTKASNDSEETLVEEVVKPKLEEWDDKVDYDVKSLNEDLARILSIVSNTSGSQPEVRSEKTTEETAAEKKIANNGIINELPSAVDEKDSIVSEADSVFAMDEWDNLSYQVDDRVVGPATIREPPPQPPRSEFDAQTLLENIRSHRSLHPHSDFDLLTCKALPLLRRIAVATEFCDHL